MRILSAPDELKEEIASVKKKGQTIGFVPTMGALHEGHVSLFSQAMEQNDCTVVSIFVNPLQFNNTLDLEKYPRALEEDIKLLEQHNVDILFAPSEEELYPTEPKVTIQFGALSQRMEGEFRKGHFEGVGIVVSKLLHLTQPDKAYFGLKDLQQFLLIRTLCDDLNFPTEIIGVPTVRESSGLALSSRNRRLTQEGLHIATIIQRELNKIREGIKEGNSLIDLIKSARESYNSREGFQLEYLEAVNPKDLVSVSDYSELDELAVCVAGYVEGVRLIDNLYLRLK